MMNTPVIGIDLGTTQSCVAVFWEGTVKVIPNEDGNRFIPSYVAFTPTKYSVGELAKNQMTTNPQYTIFDIKRLIGRRYADPVIQMNLNDWPFKVINNDGKPNVLALYKGKPKLLTPEEIAAMIIAEMKKAAETYLGMKVKKAVMTAPASFNYAQRQAMRDAAAIAGLNVIRVLSESTAVSMAYSFTKHLNEKKLVAILNLGGGTCSVSLVTTGSSHQVESIAGSDTGGEDFDQRMVKHFIQQITKKYNKDLSSDKRSLGRLKVACEKAKKVLSTCNRVNIEIDNLFEEVDFHSVITREEFDGMNKALFEDVLKTLNEARRSDLSVYSDVVLVGGSTRIPRIQELLRDRYWVLDKSMMGGEGAACGAALEGAILNYVEGVPNIKLADVVPFNLSREMSDGRAEVITVKHKPIPSKNSFWCSYKEPIKLYEGQNMLTKNDLLIRELQIEMPMDGTMVLVSFNVDINDTLSATAINNTTTKMYMCRLKDHQCLDRKVIERMAKGLDNFRKEGEKQREIEEARNDLEEYCYVIKETAKDHVIAKIDEMLKWLESHPNDRQEIDRKRRELELLSNMADTQYEVAAKKLKCNNFACSSVDECVSTMDPCTFQLDGCLESLKACDVVEHEGVCCFKSTTCSMCQWKGAVGDLVWHFNEKHPKAILWNDEFEVHLVHSYEIHSLLLYRDEVFNVKRKCNMENGTLQFSVIHHRITDSTPEYRYQMAFQGTSKENICIKKPPKSTQEDNVTEISSDELMKDLNNPAVIKATIEIIKPEGTTSLTETETEKKSHPNIDYDLLTELQCPVCFNYILPPIYQCITGHSVCEKCKDRITRCPLCEKPLKDTHNITLEKITQMLIFPCKFTDNGCDFASKPAEIKEHQKHCPRRPYPCPVQGYDMCPCKMTIEKMFPHILDLHQNHVLTTNTVNVHTGAGYFDREHSTCYIIKLKKLFKLQYMYKVGTFYWSLQLIGPPNEAKGYQFEIDIRDNSSANQRMLMRSMCAPLNEKNCSFTTKGSYIFIQLDQIRSFITNIFTYRIRVIV